MSSSACRLCALGAARTERGTHYVDRSGKLVEEICPAVRLASAEAEQALRDAFSVATGHVGCGDSACEFVPRVRGMAASSGCRCKHRAFATSALAGLYRAVEQYLQGVAR